MKPCDYHSENNEDMNLLKGMDTGYANTTNSFRPNNDMSTIQTRPHVQAQNHYSHNELDIFCTFYFPTGFGWGEEKKSMSKK